MEDTHIIRLYEERLENAIAETKIKYGRIIKYNFMLVQCILFVVYYSVYIILLTKKKVNG